MGQTKTIFTFLGLGANLGDRPSSLARAASLLESGGFELLAASGLYETPPWGNTGQPAFLNQVLKGTWPGEAAALLQLIHDTETALGRIRTTVWGPRTIDIDILLHGDLQLRSQRLTIPHPYLHERAFVLVPLAEIAPELVLPGLQIDVQMALRALPVEEVEGVKRWEPPKIDPASPFGV